MSRITPRLESLSNERGVRYETLRHSVDYTAKAAAHDTHTPPDEFAKTVIVCIDGRYAMVVAVSKDY